MPEQTKQMIFRQQETALPKVNGVLPSRAGNENARRPILFISHYCGRNGAPLILLEFLKWLRANTEIPMTVLLRQRGELEEEYRAVASVMHVPRLPRIAAGIVRRIGGKEAIEKMEDSILARKVKKLNPGLIFSNTITNTRELQALSRLRIPTICHVHEMEYWIRYELGLQKALAIVPLIKRFIAVGDAVKEFLVSGLGVKPNAIDIVREFPWGGGQSPENSPALRESTRRELGAGGNAFVIGACGTVDWRKGSDLFIQAAREMVKMRSDCEFRFIWVGGPITGGFFDQLQFDIKKSNLQDVVTFLGPCESPGKYYSAMDAFLLPSREDPCPLVMLEAAGHGLPIVCFLGSGGAAEFTEDDAGIAVPYLDVTAMAEALCRLQSESEWAARLGESGKKRTRRRHDPEQQCRSLFDVISRTVPQFVS